MKAFSLIFYPHFCILPAQFQIREGSHSGLVHLLGHRLRRGPAAGGKSSQHMYWVYIIQSQSSRRYYVGMTEDLPQRLRHHNSGANTSTRRKGPWAFVYQEACLDKTSAWKRERQIKKYKGGAAFRKLLQSHGGVA